MKVLILAGAGWVGHHVANGLVRTGNEVHVIHRSMSGRFVPELDGRVHHILGNIQDFSALEKAMDKVSPEVVIDILPDPGTIERNCRLFNGRVKHYLQCSSAGVYVPTAKSPVGENAPTYYREDFGPAFIAKNKCDEIALSFYTAWGLPATVIRPVVILGKGFVPLELWGFRNPEFFRKILAGEVICVSAATDTTMMTAVNVRDVAETFVQAVLKPDRSIGHIFNAASWEPFSHSQYLDAIANVIGREPVVGYFDTEEIIARKTGEPLFYESDYRFFMHDLSVSGEKAGRLLGVRAAKTLEEVLAECLGEFLSLPLRR